MKMKKHTVRVQVQYIKTHTKEKPNNSVIAKQQKPDFDEEAEWQKYQRMKKGFWGRLFDE